MTNKEYIDINVMEENGRLYHNRRLDTIESLIPNPYKMCIRDSSKDHGFHSFHTTGGIVNRTHVDEPV